MLTHKRLAVWACHVLKVFVPCPHSLCGCLRMHNHCRRLELAENSALLRYLLIYSTLELVVLLSLLSLSLSPSLFIYLFLKRYIDGRIFKK